jgi:hypothetical protein
MGIQQMKHIRTCLVLLICCFCFFLYNKPQAGIIASYGIEGGLAVSNVTGDYYLVTPKSRFSYTAGVQVEWLKSSIISVITELKYIQKGYSFDATNTKILPDGTIQDLGTATYLHRMDYISLPVLIRAEYKKYPLIPYLQVGPRVDFNLPSSRFEWIDVELDYKKTVMGGSAGAGMNYSVNKKMIVGVSVLYDFDFTKALESPSLKNNSIVVELNINVIPQY